MNLLFKICTLLVLALLFFSSYATASETTEHSRFSIGAGAYMLAILNPEPYERDEFTGPALVVKGALNKHLAVRGSYYDLSYNNDSDFSETRLTGFDGQILFGVNFYQGGNIFIGAGYFRETMEITLYNGYDQIKVEPTFTGAELVYGVGYNWEHAGIELITNFRETDDYEEFTRIDHDFAISGSVSIVCRF